MKILEKVPQEGWMFLTIVLGAVLGTLVLVIPIQLMKSKLMRSALNASILGIPLPNV